MTNTRSAYGMISCRRCSVSKTVVPMSRLIFFTVSKKSEAAMGSSWEVGSSRISKDGCIAITEARFRSCFCPPDNSDTFL